MSSLRVHGRRIYVLASLASFICRAGSVASCSSGDAIFFPCGKTSLCCHPVIIDTLWLHLGSTLLIQDNLFIVTSLISSLLPTSCEATFTGSRDQALNILRVMWPPSSSPGPLTPRKVGFSSALPFPQIPHDPRGAWETVHTNSLLLKG